MDRSVALFGGGGVVHENTRAQAGEKPILSETEGGSISGDAREVPKDWVLCLLSIEVMNQSVLPQGPYTLRKKMEACRDYPRLALDIHALCQDDIVTHFLLSWFLDEMHRHCTVCFPALPFSAAQCEATDSRRFVLPPVVFL